VVGESSEGEEPIAEAVDIGEDERGQAIGECEGDEEAFSAAADGAGEVESSGELGAGGEDELAEVWQLGLGGVDFGFQASGDVGVEGWEAGGGYGGGCGEVGADDEEVVLDGAELSKEGLGGRDGGEADSGVEFVDGAAAFDAGVGLAGTGAAEEAGGAVIAGAGVDGHGGIFGCWVVIFKWREVRSQDSGVSVAFGEGGFHFCGPFFGKGSEGFEFEVGGKAIEDEVEVEAVVLLGGRLLGIDGGGEGEF